MNEYSLKILAYIIKGCFLSLSKQYQLFIRDIEKFIEININGTLKHSKKKNNVKEETEKEDKEMLAETEKFTMQNFSLFSENTLFEKFLENCNMTQQIQKTLKRINKSFSSIDFENMSTDKKKEYLKKHFIKPLTESLPMSSDFFAPSDMKDINQCEGKEFSDYIQFDMNQLNDDDMLQQLSNRLTQSVHDIDQGEIKEEIQIKLIDADVQKYKSNLFRKDNIIEINLQEYINQIDNTSNEDDSEEVYIKNIKTLMKNVSLEKLKDKIGTIDSFENNSYKDFSFIFSQSNILENSTFNLRNVSNHSNKTQNTILSALNDGNDYKDIEINSFGSNKTFSVKSKTQLLSERLDIQSCISDIISNLKNYQEITINQLNRKVTSKLSSFNDKNDKEKCSSIFYNMLIVCQNNQYQLKQSEPFGNFFLTD